MVVKSVVFRLRLIHCRNQRDQDQRIDRIMQKLRTHFNVSTANLGPKPDTDLIALAVTSVAREKRDSLEVLERVADALSMHPEAQIIGEPDWV